MTSRPEGAKELEEERIAVAVHGERFVAGVCRTSGVLMSPCKSCQRVAALCVEYGEEQVEAAPHCMTLPLDWAGACGRCHQPADQHETKHCCLSQTAIEQREDLRKECGDLRAQLQTLRGELAEARREYEGPMAEEIARLKEEKAALETRVKGEIATWAVAAAHAQTALAQLEARERALLEAAREFVIVQNILEGQRPDFPGSSLVAGKVAFTKLERTVNAALTPRPHHE